MARNGLRQGSPGLLPWRSYDRTDSAPDPVLDEFSGSRRLPKLLLRGVCKSYHTPRGTTLALSHVDMAVSDGEFVCLVGPSGCGKSTLLNLIAGLDRHTSGEIMTDGRNVAGPGTDRLLLFQEPALFPWLNVIQNVEFGLKMAGVAARIRRARAEAALRLVHLSGFTNAFAHELSGGMKQRVALARALVMEPQMLLMDEPFAALDAQTRAMLHEELQSAWLATGKTIIFVTHNIEEAVRLGDRVIVFSPRPGRIRTEIAVDVPRPRPAGDPAEFGRAIRRIADELRTDGESANEGGERNAGEHEATAISCPAGSHMASRL